MAVLSGQELETLQDAFARLLADHCSEAQVRHWMTGRQGFDDALWQAIAGMGLTGLLVDEKYGGISAGHTAMERIMEQAGAALLGAPLIASAVMAVSALQASGDEAAMARLLPKLFRLLGRRRRAKHRPPA